MKRIALLFLLTYTLQLSAQKLPLLPEHVFKAYGTYEKGVLSLKEAKSISCPDRYFRFLHFYKGEISDYYFYNTNDSLISYKALIKGTTLKKLKTYFLKYQYRLVTDEPLRLLLANDRYILTCTPLMRSPDSDIVVSYEKLYNSGCYQ